MHRIAPRAAFCPQFPVLWCQQVGQTSIVNCSDQLQLSIWDREYQCGKRSGKIGTFTTTNRDNNCDTPEQLQQGLPSDPSDSATTTAG